MLSTVTSTKVAALAQHFLTPVSYSNSAEIEPSDILYGEQQAPWCESSYSLYSRVMAEV